MTSQRAIHVYTAQIGAYQGPDALDITVTKAQGPAHLFALTEKEERQSYLAFLRKSYRERRSAWTTLLSRQRLVLLCSCPPGTLSCHRYVLADVLSKLGATLGGEIRTALTTPQRRPQSIPRTKRVR